MFFLFVKNLEVLKRLRTFDPKGARSAIERTVIVSQENYTESLLKIFNMTDCKTFDTPMETKLNVNIGVIVNNYVPGFVPCYLMV